MPKQGPKNAPQADPSLDGLDAAKRRTLKKLALGAAFVTPVVASFSMDGLTISRVHAESANGSGLAKDEDKKDKHHKKHHMHSNQPHYPNQPSYPNQTVPL
jgi:hypothetical protein